MVTNCRFIDKCQSALGKTRQKQSDCYVICLRKKSSISFLVFVIRLYGNIPIQVTCWYMGQTSFVALMMFVTDIGASSRISSFD